MANKDDEKNKKPSQDDVLLREVDQELAEERQWAMFRKHGPLVIAAASVVVLGVAGGQIFASMKNRSSQSGAIAFRDAMEQLADDPANGRIALDEFAANAPGGYRVLALMRRASSLVQEDEAIAARAVYREVYTDGAAPKRLQQYARLRAALISLNDDRDAVIEDLGDLRFDESALGFHARELEAVAALQAGDYGTAKSLFSAASTNLDTPSAVRQRAEEYGALAAAAVAGIKVPSDLSVPPAAEPIGLGLDLPTDVDEAPAENTQIQSIQDGAEPSGEGADEAPLPASSDISGGAENTEATPADAAPDAAPADSTSNEETPSGDQQSE